MSFNDLWGIDNDTSTPQEQGREAALNIYEKLLAMDSAQEAENKLMLFIDHWDRLPDGFRKGFVSSVFRVLIQLFTVLRK